MMEITSEQRSRCAIKDGCVDRKDMADGIKATTDAKAEDIVIPDIMKGGERDV